VISRDPATGEVLMQIAPTDLETQISAARAAYAGWACQPLSARVDAVRRLTSALRQRSQEFAEAIAHDTGRPFGTVFPRLKVRWHGWMVAFAPMPTDAPTADRKAAPMARLPFGISRWVFWRSSHLSASRC
jgi:hypothetical protein